MELERFGNFRKIISVVTRILQYVVYTVVLTEVTIFNGVNAHYGRF